MLGSRWDDFSSDELEALQQVIESNLNEFRATEQISNAIAKIGTSQYTPLNYTSHLRRIYAEVILALEQRHTADS